jgi:lipopolysaccharide transport system ATP-binding protein
VADIVAEHLGKQYSVYHKQRPKTVVEVFKQRWRHMRPLEKVWTLRDVNLHVRSGQMVGLVGANGAGKSTLLRLLGGVGRPDEGTIHTSGRIGAIYDLGAGFHPDLTGRENLYVGGVISGMTRDQVTAHFDAIVAFAEAESYIDYPLRTYSTGMQMRLAFSLAAHINPDILLIDEVLAVGDLAFQMKCVERIRSFKEQGCAVLLVSHDDDMVEELCDRVIWLHKGRVVAEGEAGVVINQYRAAMEIENRRKRAQKVATQPTAKGDELRLIEKRFGSLEMDITNVRLLNETGVDTAKIASGDELTVQIDFHAPQTTTTPIFVVTISGKDGFVYYEANTASNGTNKSHVRGQGTLHLGLERLDLAGGDYFVDVGAFTPDWSHAYDYQWHVCPLKVLSEDNDRGIIRPPHRWEFS